jgi:predicted dehydrogenase
LVAATGTQFGSQFPQDSKLHGEGNLRHEPGASWSSAKPLSGSANFDGLRPLPWDTALDAVAIATPVNQHHALAKAALLAGKHTFIEKPMASSSAQCEELIDIAKQKGLVLMVGHTYLYSAPVKKIVDLVDSGDIGEIRYINCRRLNLGLFQKDINVAWDLAPHDISIILHVFREPPLSVNCSGNAHVTAGIEDVTNMSLSLAKNDLRLFKAAGLSQERSAK